MGVGGRGSGRKLRVALTQSEGRLEGLEQGLLERGFEVVRTPLIETKPRLSEGVKRQARALLDCPWLLFTSRTAVEAWHALGLPFGQTRVGAVGRKTAAAVEQFGAVNLVGEPQTSEGLAETFLRSAEASGPVGLPRGDRALPTLQDRLEQSGFETRPLVIYQTLERSWDADAVDVIVLSSPSAVEALPRDVRERAKLIALGPSTGAKLRAYGWRYEQAERPDGEAVLALLGRC